MYALSALEHWDCGYKITLKACMYVCSVSVFVLSCVGGNLATDCMDRPCSPTKYPWARFINPISGKIWATARQRYSCRYVPSRNTTVTQYFSRYKDILFMIQYVCAIACLLRIHCEKVKQSLYRPRQALRVPGGGGSQISRQSTHEGCKVVSPKHRPA